jgi:hypothetical protein
MFRRFSEQRYLVPWLRPGLSYSQLRRTVARLRSGAVRLVDPRISPALLADLLEKSIEQDLRVKAVVREVREYDALKKAVEERYAAERRRSFVAGFHRLKASPEARNPESPVAEKVRRMHRKRRSELGRPRR